MFEFDRTQEPDDFPDQDELAAQLVNMIEEGGSRVLGWFVTPRLEHDATHPRIEDLVEGQVEEQQVA
jgi:hypothetical protein